MPFDAKFEALTGHAPFPWQCELFERLTTDRIPAQCDLPTGLGKTSVIAVWLLALAQRPSLPRRLVYVVNRRTVVDQSTSEAERIRENLQDERLQSTRDALSRLGVLSLERPLAISTLRGEFADNAEWRHDPTRASVVVGTVDMVGSRLLFSGYGCGFKTRPLHAGFLGHDALLIHDEAHLEPAFQKLLEAVVQEQSRSGDSRPLRVMALSATSRSIDAGDRLGLSEADEKHPVVRRRLHAKKGIALHRCPAKELSERAADLAKQKNGAVLIFLRTVENVQRCVARLGKANVAVLTGTVRGFERDALARKNPVFARFLPTPPSDVQPTAGTVFLVATSAGEVGVDISADHLITDLSTFESMAQRFGRLNRYGLGDAEIEVVRDEELTAPKQKQSAADDEEEEDDVGEDAYEAARYATADLLNELPRRSDGRLDASPAALRGLSAERRLAAFAPTPVIPHADEILFDRWSLTTIRGAFAGRPPVADWLHGIAAWEPPSTVVAWRQEVGLLGADAVDDLNELMADYPLRARERLSDRTDRVVKELKKLVERNTEPSTVWFIKDDEIWIEDLEELLTRHERDKVTLSNATVLLSPRAGGLRATGLLDGAEPFDASREYDLGSWAQGEPERVVRVVDAEGSSEPPAGMRLVRSHRLGDPDGDDVSLWQLFVRPSRADDDGSRTSRKPLPLEKHLTDTERWAKRLVEASGLRGVEAGAVIRAARWHDLGKARETWQRSIRNFGYPESAALAKGRVVPAELGHYRHELGSLHDAEKMPGFASLAEEERELLLHLVAAHHGRARPHFPQQEVMDESVSDARLAQTASAVPLRFARLQRKYGRWGLAWLESLVRAADYLASDEDLTP